MVSVDICLTSISIVKHLSPKCQNAKGKNRPVATNYPFLKILVPLEQLLVGVWEAPNPAVEVAINWNLKGAFSMASKKVEMYAKKRYELDEIKNKIKEEFDKRKFSDVEFKDEIIRELGDTKTLLLIFENWFLRTGSYASLVIMLSEYQGYQSADIIATGGKEAFFSFGAEGDFAKFGEDALKNLGFQGKVR